MHQEHHQSPCRLQTVLTLGLAVAVILAQGCSMFRISINEKDPATSDPLSASYDQRDLLSWADQISRDILAHPFPPPREQDAILVVMGIENRTRTHADMKAISDTIRTRMMERSKVRFVNAARRDDLLKEQGYQLENATPETRSAIGRQLGAGYMLTGSLIEIGQESGREVRASKKEDVYFQLTVEITNLETGLIEVTKQRDRLRRASKPLIGW